MSGDEDLQKRTEEALEKMVRQILDASVDYLGQVDLTLHVNQAEANAVMQFLRVAREAQQKAWEEKRKQEAQKK